MPRRRKKLLIFWAVALGICTALAALCSTNAAAIHFLLPLAGRCCGVEIVADKASFNVFTGFFSAENLRIKSRNEVRFFAKKGSAYCSFLPLLQGNFRFFRLRVDGGRLSLYRNRFNDWSWDDSVLYAKEPEPPFETYPLWVVEDSLFENSTLSITVGDAENRSSVTFHEMHLYSGTFRNGGVTDFTGIAKAHLGGGEHVQLDSVRTRANLQMAFSRQWDLKSIRLRGESCGISGRVGQQKVQDNRFCVDLAANASRNGMQLRKLEFLQYRNQEIRSCIDVYGWGALMKLAGELNFRQFRLSNEFLGVSSSVLFGIDPGTAELNFSGRLIRHENYFSSSGTLLFRRTGDAFSGRKKLEVPDFQIMGSHDFTVDWNKLRTAVSDVNFIFTTPGGSGYLKLASPVSYSWETGEEEWKRAKLYLKFKGIDVRILPQFIRQEIRPLLPCGGLDGDYELIASPTLRRFFVSGCGIIRRLRGDLCGDSCFLQLKGSVSDNGAVGLDRVTAELRRCGVLSASALLSGQCALSGSDGALNLNVKILSPELFAMMPFLWSHNLQQAANQWQISQGELNTRMSWKKSDNAFRLADLLFYLKNRNGEWAEIRSPVQILSMKDYHGSEKNSLEIAFHSRADSFNWYLADTPFSFENGKVDGKILVSVPDRGTMFACEGRVGFSEPQICWKKPDGRLLRRGDLAGEIQFRCSTPDYNAFQVPQLELHLFKDGVSALRLDAPGKFALQEGSLQTKILLRYANEHALQILFPELRQTVGLHGNAMLDFRKDFRVWDADCALSIDRLRLNDEEILTGSCGFRIGKSPEQTKVHDLSLLVRNQLRPLIACRGKYQYDAASDKADLHLESPTFDFDSCSKLLAIVYPQIDEICSDLDRETASSGTEEIPQLRIPFRNLNADFLFRQLLIGNGIDLTCRGKCVFTPAGFAAENLTFTLDNQTIPASLSARNRPNGVEFHCMLASEKKLDLAKILNIFFPQTRGISGALEKAKLDLRWIWQNGEDSFWRTLGGNFAFEFRELLFSQQSVSDNVARLLLFPVNLAFRLGGAVTASSTQELLRQLSLKGLQIGGLPELEFYRGSFAGNLNGGKLKISRCDFAGSPVRRLTFSGEADLAGRQELALKARISLFGSQLTFPVTGSLESPQIPVSGSFSDNLKNIGEKIGNFNIISFTRPEKNEDAALFQLNEIASPQVVNRIRSMFIYFSRQDGKK